VFQDTLSHNQTLFLESRITSSLMQGRVVVCMSRSANVFGCSKSTAADLLGTNGCESGTMMGVDGELAMAKGVWGDGTARQEELWKCSPDGRMERGNVRTPEGRKGKGCMR
jgi:hypothetical protein